MSMLICLSPGGDGDGENLIRSACSQRFGASAQGGAGGADIVHKQHGKTDVFGRTESALQVGGPLLRAQAHLVPFPAVPPEQ